MREVSHRHQRSVSLFSGVHARERINQVARERKARRMFNSFAPAARRCSSEKNNRAPPPHAYSVLSDGRTIEIHPVRVANDFQLFPSAVSLCHEREREVEVETASCVERAAAEHAIST